MKLSENFYDFDIDIKSDKSKTIGTLSFKNGEYIIRLFSTDLKTSIRRKVGIGSAIDISKKLEETFQFKCKQCKNRLSLFKGEIHHGCLSCL